MSSGPDKTAAIHGNLLRSSRFLSRRCFRNAVLLLWQQSGDKTLPLCQRWLKHFRLELVNTDVQHCRTEICLDCSEGIFFPTTEVFRDVLTERKGHLVQTKLPLSMEISLAAIASSHSADSGNNRLKRKCLLNVNTG